MVFKDHANAIYAEWIIRFVGPGDSAWKQVLSEILFVDKKGMQTQPEGPGYLFYKLTQNQKTKLIRRLPREAIYMKTCLKAFWNLNLEPDLSDMAHVGSESLWFNHRFHVDISHADRAFMTQYVDAYLLSDIMDAATDRPFRKSDWADMIEESYEKVHGVKPTDEFITIKSLAMSRAVKQVPKYIKRLLSTQLNFTPAEDELTALVD